MAASRKRSKKQSAASGGRPHRPLPTFFIDECLGRYAVPDALKAAGCSVILHAEVFKPGTLDPDWLKSLAEHRDDWVILTKDTRIRRRELERDALLSAGVRVFALTAGNLSGDAQASAFVRGLRAILRFSQASWPFIAIVTAAGGVKRVEP